jgi:hypothetical protein
MNYADFVRRMFAAGATEEAVVLALEALQSKDDEAYSAWEQAEARRAKDRARKREMRAVRRAIDNPCTDVPIDVPGMSADIPQTSTDFPQTTPSPPPNPPPTPTLNTPPISPQTSKRGTRLPADWSPSEADYTAAREAGLTTAQIDREVLSFRDYWIAKPGKEGLKLDWSATFRNWCRRAADRLPRTLDRSNDRSRQGRIPGPDSLTSAIDRVFGIGDGVPPRDVVPPGDDGGGPLLDFASAGRAYGFA